MHKYSSEQNTFFQAPSCEASFPCASSFDMIITGIAAAMSVFLVVGAVCVDRRLCMLLAALIIIRVIIRSVISVRRKSFQT